MVDFFLYEFSCYFKFKPSDEIGKTTPSRVSQPTDD